MGSLGGPRPSYPPRPSEATDLHDHEEIRAMMSLCLPLCLGLLSVQTSTTDWPRFQGPNRNGKVAAVPSDYDWGEDGPGVVWMGEVEAGYGGVSVKDGEVFLLDRDAGGDILRVLDLETGEEKWSTGYEAPGRVNFPGSRSVPTVEEEYVYTLGVFGHVTCFDREDGAIAWQTDMTEVYGGEQPVFGWSGSPLVYDGTVVMTPLGRDIGLVGVDAETGEELWVTESVGYSHSSPVLLHLLGETQLVFLSNANSGSGQDQAAPTIISAFDPEDGTPLWQTETMLTRLPIPGPVQVDDERFFLTGGYRAGSTMMKITKDGGDYAFEELFHIDRGAQVHLPILHDEHLFVIVNENWNDQRSRRKEGGLLCLDLDGEEVWRTADDPYLGRGNLLLAGDNLLIQDGYSGTLRVVPATSAGYAPIAEVNVFGVEDERDHNMWAPMALAGNYLLLRSQEELLCLEL
jgi:outer membrane protein assembly factor BamB